MYSSSIPDLSLNVEQATICVDLLFPRCSLIVRVVYLCMPTGVVLAVVLRVKVRLRLDFGWHTAVVSLIYL